MEKPPSWIDAAIDAAAKVFDGLAALILCVAAGLAPVIVMAEFGIVPGLLTVICILLILIYRRLGRPPKNTAGEP